MEAVELATGAAPPSGPGSVSGGERRSRIRCAYPSRKRTSSCVRSDATLPRLCSLGVVDVDHVKRAPRGSGESQVVTDRGSRTTRGLAAGIELGGRERKVATSTPTERACPAARNVVKLRHAVERARRLSLRVSDRGAPMSRFDARWASIGTGHPRCGRSLAKLALRRGPGKYQLGAEASCQAVQTARVPRIAVERLTQRSRSRLEATAAAFGKFPGFGWFVARDAHVQDACACDVAYRSYDPCRVWPGTPEPARADVPRGRKSLADFHALEVRERTRSCASSEPERRRVRAQGAREPPRLSSVWAGYLRLDRQARPLFGGRAHASRSRSRSGRRSTTRCSGDEPASAYIGRRAALAQMIRESPSAAIACRRRHDRP